MDLEWILKNDVIVSFKEKHELEEYLTWLQSKQLKMDKQKITEVFQKVIHEELFCYSAKSNTFDKANFFKEYNKIIIPFSCLKIKEELYIIQKIKLSDSRSLEKISVENGYLYCVDYTDSNWVFVPK